MRISGFTIVRNAVLYDFPVVEAIRSALPLCDEFIVNVGASDDATLDLIDGIGSDKLRIITTVWDSTRREGGRVLADETTRALRACTGDWCLYVQSDEVLHENDYPALRKAMTRHAENPRIEGLEFNYIHFYGSYHCFQDNRRNWYRHEVRIVRNRPELFSYGDAKGFRVTEPDGTVRKLRVRQSGASVYHYGWVKPPRNMRTKKIETDRLWFSDEIIEREKEIITEENIFLDKGNLKRFTGTHPAVMHERVAAARWDFDDRIDGQLPDSVRHIIIFLEPLLKRLRKMLGLKSTARCHFR